MSSPRSNRAACLAMLGIGLAAWAVLPVGAEEKQGMPDLAQVEQTCLPTSTANLIIWFGQHGYPKLLLSGDTEDERELHTLHRIMACTDARFDWGTRQDAVTSGIEKFIKEAGYDCDVEYRGLNYPDPDDKTVHTAPAAFSQDWLKENDDPNKGFILLLSYCAYNESTNTFTYAWNAGHAVTLVNAMPNMILIHDPAHYEDEPGRKIVTPEVLTSGTWQSRGLTAPVSGMMLLSGSLLEAPPNAQVMLTGAVCITMHPVTPPATMSPPSPATGPDAVLAGPVNRSSGPAGSPSTPAPAKSASTGWVMWFFDLLFRK